MKGKTKEQKGITLIALIITIVVLLILAAVAISSITNDGILSYATNAAKEYNQAVANEQDMLGQYVNYLNNHTGSSNNGGLGSGSTSYEAYTVGQEVKVVVDEVEHEFYVIKDSSVTEDKVWLLPKENIDTTNLAQSASASTVDFSSEYYWANDFTSSPYDIVEPATIPESHIAAKAAYDYGEKVGGAGRLMTYAEADELSKNTTFFSKLDETNFWLGSAENQASVWFIYGGGDDLGFNYMDIEGNRGVRPVVEISKSKLS